MTTLPSLAQIYRTTVAEPTRLNALTGTTLEVGQILHVPGHSAVPAPVFTAPSTPDLAGLTVTAPATLRGGDAFVVRLGGVRATGPCPLLE